MGMLFNLGTKTYRKLFARPFFYKWNRWVLLCGLKGLGINNFSDFHSGEFSFLKKQISKKKNPILIDVGANVGKWSEKALSFNSSSRIYAVEPNPVSFRSLLQFPLLKAFNVALGCEKKAMTMYLKKSDPTSPLASLNKDAIVRLTSEIEEVNIQMTTLDQLIEEEKIPEVTLLKIDVEGYEYDVLKGAKRSLEKGIINTIQFEFNDMNLFTRHFLKDFQDLLPDFTFYRLLPHGKIPLRNYDAYLKEIFAYQNIIAIRK